MIERKIAEKFLGKIVGIVRRDNGRQVFCRGRLIEVTDTAIILEYYDTIQAVSLEALDNIRELKNAPGR